MRTTGTFKIKRYLYKRLKYSEIYLYVKDIYFLIISILVECTRNFPKTTAKQNRPKIQRHGNPNTNITRDTILLVIIAITSYQILHVTIYY